jgi:molybdopterin converting factor subunit 1
MKVRLLLFARYAELAGAPMLEVEAAAAPTLGDLWDAVRAKVPALAGESAPMMAVDQIYAAPERIVGPGQEVAFFPPVSGG